MNHLASTVSNDTRLPCFLRHFWKEQVKCTFCLGIFATWHDSSQLLNSFHQLPNVSVSPNILDQVLASSDAAFVDIARPSSLSSLLSSSLLLSKTRLHGQAWYLHQTFFLPGRGFDQTRNFENWVQTSLSRTLVFRLHFFILPWTPLEHLSNQF